MLFVKKSRKYFLLIYFHITLGPYNNFWLVMNRNLEKQSPQKQYELQQETKQTKKFVQDSFHIDYANTSKIFYELNQSSHGVKVNNYLCYQQGQTLYKITEIMYEDKLIRIQDKFEVSIDPAHLSSTYCIDESKTKKQNTNCSRSIQKVRIFNKNCTKTGKSLRKDKKNIVKNIIKILISWLQKKYNTSQVYASTLAQLLNTLKVQNFNNRLIQKIISSKIMNKVFLQFIEGNAEQEIKYSRIQDKESHYQALEIYKSLLKGNSKHFGSQNSQSEFHSQNQQMNQKYNGMRNLNINNAQNSNIIQQQCQAIKKQQQCEQKSEKIIIQDIKQKA